MTKQVSLRMPYLRAWLIVIYRIFTRRTGG
jgi:hypothetical protein